MPRRRPALAVGLTSVILGVVLVFLASFNDGVSDRPVLFWVALPLLAVGFLMVRSALRQRPARN